MFFTIEMSIEQWQGLDMANEAGVPAWNMFEPGLMNFSTRDRICRAAEEVRQWPMYFDDSGSIHINQLIARARLSVLKHGVRLVVVDYAQRVKGNGKEMRHQIGNVAEMLAEFAKEYKVGVVLLSQLARRGDINIRPTMQDLKESGDLEAHAHVVVLNYRPVDRDTESFLGEDELIIAKQRFGPVGKVNVKYDPNSMTFRER